MMVWVRSEVDSARTLSRAEAAAWGSWRWCNVVGGRWPRSGPRPWQPGGACRWSQRPQRNTSGPDTGRRGWPFSESACSLLICGTMTVVAEFTRDKLERKKYMAVWRWGIPWMAAMMTELPPILTRYMARKLAKSHTRCLGSLVSPRREEFSGKPCFPSSLISQIKTKKY